MPGLSQIVNGDIFLKGTKILLGINSNGLLCTNESVPVNFNTKLIREFAGFVYNQSGLSSININPDYTYPGSPVCNFAIGYNGLNIYNNFSLGTYQITKIQLTNESSGNILKCTYNGTYNNIFNIQLIYTFDVNGDYFQVIGKITNISNTTLNNIKFLYDYDPDNSVDIGGYYTTNNKIIYQTNTDNKCCVFAGSMPDSSVPGIYLFTDDLSANVYYGGFDNFNTNDTLFDTILPKNSMLSDDIGNSILFKKSNLAPQEEYNFNFYIGFTIEQLIEQLVNSITSLIAVPNPPPLALYNGLSLLSSIFLPRNILLNIKQNIYKLNPNLLINTYKFYSSEHDIADIDLFGNILGKKVGKFYIIVTDMSGSIIYTTPYFIDVIGSLILQGSGGVNLF